MADLMKFVDQLVVVSKKPLSARNQIAVKVLPIIVFFFFFPTVLFIIPKMIIDVWLHLPTLFRFSIRIFPGGALVVLGLFFLNTSTTAQRNIGKGTPMPLYATQKLVVEKPYSYCRNPLYFGLITFFLGISIIIGSLSSLAMVLTFTMIILSYVKLIEEKELEKRFGYDYLEYKKGTPLIIPKLPPFKECKK